MRTLDLSHDYASPPKDVWALATDFGALQQICKPLVYFEGLPEGRCTQGLEAEVQVRLFGRLPAQPYFMKVLEQDDEAMILRSSERGAGVKRWEHTMRVAPHSGGSRLTDHIEIDAGWMTPLFVWWARKLYRHRHKPRLRLLGEGGPA